MSKAGLPFLTGGTLGLVAVQGQRGCMCAHIGNICILQSLLQLASQRLRAHHGWEHSVHATQVLHQVLQERSLLRGGCQMRPLSMKLSCEEWQLRDAAAGGGWLHAEALICQVVCTL